MAKGDEPLRSFGDLMQFFKKAQPEPVVKAKVIKPVVEAVVETIETTQSDVSAAANSSDTAAPVSAEPQGDGAMPAS
jgi:protein Tex